MRLAVNALSREGYAEDFFTLNCVAAPAKS